MKRKIISISLSFILIALTCVGIYGIYYFQNKISYPWYFEKLNILENQYYGNNKEIGVAIIDSGFNENFSKYFNNEIIKFDATGENNTADSTGHGTQMAMLIGSNSNIKSSIYGVNPNVQLYSIRVNNRIGLTTSEYLHNALEYCKTIDISILNMSLGGATYNSIIMNDIKELKDNGVFVICASGDKNTNFLYPADYEDTYCVIAQNKDGSVYELANTTSRINKVPIVVPGCDIDVFITGDTGEKFLTTRSGSSFATAIFSGYLSLYLSKNDVSPLKFDEILKTDIYKDEFVSLL